MREECVSLRTDGQILTKSQAFICIDEWFQPLFDKITQVSNMSFIYGIYTYMYVQYIYIYICIYIYII